MNDFSWIKQKIWMGFIVLIISIAVCDYAAIKTVESLLIDTAKKEISTKMNTLRIVIEDSLKKNHYSSANEFIQQFSELFKNEFSEVTLTAANGFVISSYTNTSLKGPFYELSETIQYSYEGSAHLKLVHTLNTAEDMAPFRISFILGGIILSVIFFLIALETLKRKHSENQLRHTKKLLKNISDSMPSLLATIDKKGRVLHWNFEAEKITGVPEKEALNKDLFNMFPDLFGTMEDISETVIDSGIFKKEKIKYVEDGDTHYKDMTIYPLIANGMEGAVVRIDDVTDSVNKDEMMIQAQKMESIGRLAGGVAHDFNNILTVISGYTELLLATAEISGADTSSLEEINTAVERARSLTRQLLMFSRKEKFHTEPLDINQIIHSLSKMFSRLVEEDIEFQYALKGVVPQICADKGQIEQILVNLVVNAKDALSGLEKKHIIIYTDTVRLDHENDELLEPGDYVTVSVSDNGTGIPNHIKAHIFEPFFTTKEAGKGTGLGLATVYSIVKNNKGHITVESSNNAGTRFTIYWPVCKGQCTNNTKRRDLYNGSLNGTEHILYIEDEEAVSSVTLSILNTLEYHTAAFRDGKSAINYFKEHHNSIDLIMTDITMPEMSGYQLAEKARLIEPDIKILFTSGYNSNLEKLENEHILMKPYTMKQLAQKIRQILDPLSSESH